MTKEIKSNVELRKESNKDLLHHITELEEELEVLYNERLRMMTS